MRILIILLFIVVLITFGFNTFIWITAQASSHNIPYQTNLTYGLISGGSLLILIIIYIFVKVKKL